MKRARRSRARPRVFELGAEPRRDERMLSDFQELVSCDSHEGMGQDPMLMTPAASTVRRRVFALAFVGLVVGCTYDFTVGSGTPSGAPPDPTTDSGPREGGSPVDSGRPTTGGLLCWTIV